MQERVQPIKPSNATFIKAVGYDSALKIMRVAYRTGEVQEYNNVDQWLFDRLVQWDRLYQHEICLHKRATFIEERDDHRQFICDDCHITFECRKYMGNLYQHVAGCDILRGLICN